ncbi:hypothetical protein SCLCIDRAFT_1221265 [Scleroderma citrinum Foug A]|uniref:Uncharacterized protein n=1 Tax=Scleroderma citrinum Foug A TaxID=1036808 RepID=A0A0C3DFT7_9AGAM|nr:hypothetical protein SCLCIDRAFT_1221265 [Scleroderma citrinum Foug A]
MNACVLFSATGLLTISQEQYNALQSLFFHIGGVTYEFTPNAQIWPRSLNSVLKGDPNKIYLIVVKSHRQEGLTVSESFMVSPGYSVSTPCTTTQTGLGLPRLITHMSIPTNQGHIMRSRSRVMGPYETHVCMNDVVPITYYTFHPGALETQIIPTPCSCQQVRQ